MPEKRGPWTVKERVQKYNNPWIDVVEDKVIRPDGADGIYATVKIKAGVSVLPVDENGFVYLIEIFQYAINRNSIETASGACEVDESPLDTAKRELKEELGIIAEEWVNLGMTNPMTSVIDSPTCLFIAKKLKFGQARPEGTETIRPIKMKLEEAVKMIMDGKITDNQSSVCILKAQEYLKTH
jgi:8-oxo-dGTP pyrophosphatase MutT (NUDIX family)